VNRADRKRWASAHTLADLGNLTALWLEGEIASQPGYAANCGPAEETADLVPVLAALNRSGYVTDASQPGYDEGGWQQRAAVEGFTTPDVAEHLRTVAQDARLFVRLQCASRWRNHYAHAITVTRNGGRPYTRFGVQLSRRQIRDAHLGYGACRPDVVRALCGALRVTVVDFEWGRDDALWPVLAQFAEQEAQS